VVSGDPRRFRSSKLWVAPIVGAIVATVVAAAALLVDHLVTWDAPPLPIFAGQVDTLRTMLSVIATAVTTLLALVFTIIAVVIQLASSQYSPRALRTLLKDRPSQFTIGVFVGTITYALVLLLAMRVPVGEDPASAAGLAPTLAFVLAVVSIVTFAMYSNHIAHSVRISSIANRIAEETREVIERRYPTPYVEGNDGEGWCGPASGAAVIRSPRSGVMVDVDDDALVRLASERDLTLVVVPKIGHYVPEGGRLLLVDGGGADQTGIIDLVTLADEDALEHDPAWGLRLLVDIAVRALSPGVNDPTTAAQALDRIGDLLGRLAGRQLDDLIRTDERGRVRVVVRGATWDEFMALGTDEIRLAGGGDRQVARRLREVLEFLLDVSPPPRRDPIRVRLDVLRAVTAASFDTELDLHVAEGETADRRAG
jgi:uncharacterized membrane protein